MFYIYRPFISLNWGGCSDSFFFNFCKKKIREGLIGGKMGFYLIQFNYYVLKWVEIFNTEIITIKTIASRFFCESTKNLRIPVQLAYIVTWHFENLNTFPSCFKPHFWHHNELVLLFFILVLLGSCQPFCYMCTITNNTQRKRDI